MLTYDDALNLNYYKKTTFTGWMNGMRFLIKREEPVIKEATEDTPEEKGEPKPSEKEQLTSFSSIKTSPSFPTGRRSTDILYSPL